MVKEADNPVASGALQVRSQPPGHGAVRTAVGIVRVEADEVDVGDVEGIVRLRPARKSTGLALCGQGEDVVIHAGLRRGVGTARVVISQGRPDGDLAEPPGVGIKDRPLVFGVGSGVVRVVSKHQPRVRKASGGELMKRIPHRKLVGAGGAGIPDHPDARRTRGAWHGCRAKRMGPARLVEPLIGFAPDRIKIAGVGQQAAHPHDVVLKQARVPDQIGGGFRSGAEADQSQSCPIGPPSDDHGI